MLFLQSGANFNYPSDIVKENLHGDISDSQRADASQAAMEQYYA